MWKLITLVLTAAVISLGAMSLTSFAASPDDCKEGEVWDEESQSCKPAG